MANTDKARIFRVKHPHMKGEDVEDFQRRLNAIMVDWNVDHRTKVDGDFGPATRSLAASVVHGFGASAKQQMAHGVTPELRGKIRRWQDGEFSPAERVRFRKRRDWRRRFRENHERRVVASPLAVILQDSWGYHPGVHDGVDLICPAEQPALAICRATVIRADKDGWWGLGAPSNPAVRSRGDGIIVLRSLVDVGPFKRGLNFCYGHAEQPRVKVGEVVQAGQIIGKAGLANAWHLHFMVNGRSDNRGVGDRDPMPFINYARRH